MVRQHTKEVTFSGIFFSICHISMPRDGELLLCKKKAGINVKIGNRVFKISIEKQLKVNKQ